MSIWLRRLHVKICRQAFRLAQHNARGTISITPPSAVLTHRKSSNDSRLYKMTTAEPLKNPYLNAQVLRGEATKADKAPPTCPPVDVDPCKRVIEEAPCPKPKAEEPRCKSGGDDNGSSKRNRLLIALLSALAAGGLAFWWLTSHEEEKKKVEEQPPCADAPPSPKCGVGPIPATSAELPKHVPYLLIGGGAASFSAFRAIKSNDPKAKVLVITNELHKPYMRPPLSKELWYSASQGEVKPDYRFKQWAGTERSIFFEADEFFVDPTKLDQSANGGIAVAQGYTVKKVDPKNNMVTLSDGYEICYDNCLIATGCSPKNLSIFNNVPPSVKDKVMVYRTPEDFERLKWYADAKKSITIIGNGFVGSELACSLANYAKDRDVKIYQVFPENGNMAKVLPEYLSKWTTQRVEQLGVCVMPNSSVKNVERDESMIRMELNNGKTILTDVIVVCVGCDPNTSIAASSGLEVDPTVGGFVVNAELEARRNLYAAGDASCFFDPLLGRRRVEHHDHSVVSGRLAGENMAGLKKEYSHQSMFWSDLGPEIGYEGIGLVDSKLKTVAVFALPTDSKPIRSENLSDVRKVEEVDCKDDKSLAKPNQSPSTGTTNDKTSGDCVTDCDERQHNYGRGVIFYLQNDRIVGVLLWNLFNRIGLARTLINQNEKYDDLNEVAKLFEIHS